MNPLDLISIGKKLSNIYQELSAPICRSNGLNQTEHCNVKIAFGPCPTNAN